MLLPEMKKTQNKDGKKDSMEKRLDGITARMAINLNVKKGDISIW